MKDRIKQIMESQHMTQQVFADFIGVAPATLSGIFNDRTKPTINVIEAIKKKIPAISTDWLMWGKLPMYMDQNTAEEVPQTTANVQEPMLEFGQQLSPTPTGAPRSSINSFGVRNTRPETDLDFMKNIDKSARRVVEIRVFYDDQTWESFVPAKK